MKNFIFISPNFPMTYWKFCAELKKNGMRVLGIGDSPYENLLQQLRDHYASLDALCADQDADKDAICAKLADVGYEYNASRNQFV